MDRSLYVAMTGARQIMQAQAINNHNLANATTTGFRQDLRAFRAMPVFGEGLPSRAYAMAERPGVDFTPGPVVNTGRDLDVAVQGEGWIAVQAPDGKEAYTRAGDLQIDANGLLTTGAGYAVLGDGGPIAIPPASKVEIGSDGTIAIVPQGETSTIAAERIRLVKPDPATLIKDEQGLMRARDGKPAAPDATVRLTAGALEGSNVNSAEALVTMIELARQYEMQIKMMDSSAEQAASSDQLLRLE
ncbi:MAG: flagellar basal-body rod protein FlgF [Gammaproteobacteria bacterium]